MDPEGNGTYSYVVVLGESRFEQFQIWLDGESHRVLHPGHSKGFKDTTVFGPDGMGHGCNWVIDGRQELPAVKVPKELGQESVLLKPSAAQLPDTPSGGSTSSKRPAADFGMPGDAYRVELQISGKWRNVTWEKLPAGHPKASMADQLVRERISQFYVAGSWNDWNLQEMVPDANRPGLFSTTALLWRNGGEFQVVRNRDWSQVLHPRSLTAGSTDSAAGPDDRGHGLNWSLKGQAGDAFRIQLQRHGENGVFEYHVYFERLAEESSPAAAGAPRFCIVGSWSNWATAEDMVFDGECYKFTVTIGIRSEESFQILMDGLWERVLHPDRADASPFISHVLQGPSVSAHGMNWTIGRDGGLLGAKYEVRLNLTKRGHPKSVDWRKLA